MKFIVTYWAQITILLFGIGYVIKQIIAYFIKLKEIKFNTFHVKRANLIREIYRELIALMELIPTMNFLHFATHKKVIVESPMAITKEEWQLYADRLDEQNKAIKNKF